MRASLTYTYVPSSDLPAGTGPLQLGITAGTFTQSGFIGPPPGLVFGVPVRARAHVFHQEMMCCGAPPTFTYSLPITRAALRP